MSGDGQLPPIPCVLIAPACAMSREREYLMSDYQPPPTGPPTGPPAQDPGRTMGIVGLILAIFCSLIGLIVSAIAYNTSKKAGYQNNFALAGIIVGAVSLVLGVVINFTHWVTLHEPRLTRLSTRHSSDACGIPSATTVGRVSSCLSCRSSDTKERITFKQRRMLRVFTLQSPGFENGQEMPQKYGKKAQNVSPPLEWDDAPEGTRSRARWLTSTRSPETTCIGWSPRSTRSRTRCQKGQGAPGVQASSRSSPTLAPSRRLGRTITNSRCTR